MSNTLNNQDPCSKCVNSIASSSCFYNCSESNNIKKSFVVQNIRSIRANFDLFVVNLSTIDDSPMFIFLTETFIYDYEIENYKINNYSIHANCNNSYKSGGVVVFSRNDVECVVTNASFKSCDILRVDTTVDGQNVTFVCVYRLHCCTVNFFLNEFTSYLCKIKSKNLLIVGDMNINILADSLCQDYLFLMSSFGLKCFVKDITRPASATCLDHVFSRLSTKFSLRVDVLDTRITDHSTIHGNIVYKKKESTNDPKPADIIQKHIEFDILNKDLEREHWDDVYEENDPNVAYNILLKKLNHYINLRTKFHTCRRKDKKLKPWITQSLVNKINLKNKAYKKFKKSPLNSTLKISFEILAKNNKKKEVAKTKEKYYFKKFTENGSDSKKNWCLINDIISSDSKKHVPITKILSSDNVILTGPKEIANDFNHHFVNIASDLKKSTKMNTKSDLNFENNNKTFFLKPITASELCCIVNCMENKTSVDIDGLSNCIVKAIFVNLADIFAHILNLSFICGVVPDKMKTAIVIPLFKKGNATLKENYRPISLLPIFSKIMEKVMKSRMLNFLDEHSFFSNCQFGFREKLNTEVALTNFLNEVYTSLNQDLKSAGLFVDIKKAFDMVDYQLLLKILYFTGFRGVTHQWFESYFSKRLQKVKINAVESFYKPLDIGVPQGSVLGPLLFLIYINSIFKLNFRGKAVAFADDMAFVYSGGSTETIIEEINCDLQLMSNWFHCHGLLLSEKTKCMFFQTSGCPITGDIGVKFHSPLCNELQSPTCSSQCIGIECVDEIKYLGVHVDHNLNWKKHINSLTKDFNGLLRKFYLLRKLCPTYITRGVYFALAQSKLQYGIACWGGTYESTLKPVITLQKHIIRVIYNKSRFSSSWPIFVNSRILPLRHLYYFKVLKMFFNRSGNRCFKYMNTYNFRSNNQCLHNVPRSKKEHFRRYYLSTSPYIFNKLPYAIRMCSKLSEFLTKVKDWLFTIKHSESILKLIA